jgi:putative glutamine transport system permease protein
VEPIIANLPFFMEGLLVTLQLSVGSIFFGAIAGLAFGVMRLSGRWYLHFPAVAWIETVRSIPSLLLILLVFFVLVDSGFDVSPFWAGVGALAAATSAYIAEVVRSGIAAVDRGQMEAARSSGLSHVQAMKAVILPQALRGMAPALVSEFIKTLKNTSLVAIIGAFEFFHRAQVVNARLLTEPFLIFGFVAVVYFVINFSLSQVARRLEFRVD